MTTAKKSAAPKKTAKKKVKAAKPQTFLMKSASVLACGVAMPFVASSFPVATKKGFRVVKGGVISA